MWHWQIQHKFRLSLFFLFFLIGVGTLGYYFLEGWSLVDAFYMTLITVTTVGFGEIHPLTPTGRIFTSLLILFGVGTMGYALGSFTQTLLDGQLQQYLAIRKRKREMENISEHYIVCGYGRVGKKVAKEVRLKHNTVVVVDSDPDRVEEAIRDGFYVVEGDATLEEVLRQAKVERAKALISTISSDASNVFLTLTARELNPKLFVVVRVEDPRSERKLLRAGADRVVAPYETGGVKMALLALTPSFVEFMDILSPTGGGTGYRIEELIVKSSSKVHGKTIKDSQIRQETGVIIIGIKKADGRFIFNPGPETMIHGGDILIAVGAEDQLQRLAEILHPVNQ